METYSADIIVISSSTSTIFQFLGLVSTDDDIAAVMARTNGSAIVVCDPSLQLSVLKSKYEKAEVISQHDFRKE